MTICERTGLTKPECHCAACTAALIAAHAPHATSPTRSWAIGARCRFG